LPGCRRPGQDAGLGAARASAAMALPWAGRRHGQCPAGPFGAHPGVCGELLIWGARRRARRMDWEMALALTTLFGTVGWFVFKITAWIRENVERREAAEERQAADMSELKGEVRGLKVEVTGLKVEVTGLKVEVTGLKGETKELKVAVARLCEQREGDHRVVMEIKVELARLEGKVDDLYRMHIEGMAVLRADIAALGARLDALERKVDGLEEKVDGIDMRLTALEAEFAALKETVLPRARPAGAAP